MSDEIRQLREEVARLGAEITRLSEIEAVKRCKYQYWRCFDTANIDDSLVMSMAIIGKRSHRDRDVSRIDTDSSTFRRDGA